MSAALEDAVVERYKRRIGEMRGINIIYNDPILEMFGRRIAVPDVQVLNHCGYRTCKRACKNCQTINAGVQENKNVLINYKCIILLFDRIKSVRTVRVEKVEMEREIVSEIGVCENNILQIKKNKVLVCRRIHGFLMELEGQFKNPALIIQAVKYLEYEVGVRGENSEAAAEHIVRGIRLSFFPDVSRAVRYGMSKSPKKYLLAGGSGHQ